MQLGAELLLTATDFSPSLAHTSDVLKANGNRFFGWIMPTLKTSDFVVLQTVGLDASVVSGTAHVSLTAALELLPNGLCVLLASHRTGSSRHAHIAAFRVMGRQAIVVGGLTTAGQGRARPERSDHEQHSHCHP